MILSKIFNNKNKEGWCTSWKVIANSEGGTLGPTVTFYDMTQSNFPNGQKVATYYVDSILEHGCLLHLDWDVKYWTIELNDLSIIQEWLDAVVIYFKCLKLNCSEEEIKINFKRCFRNINNLDIYFSAQEVNIDNDIVKGFLKNVDNKQYNYVFLCDTTLLIEVDLTDGIPKTGIIYDEHDSFEKLQKINEKTKLITVESLGFRKCSKCGKFFNSGFVVDDGLEYYCSEECLHSEYSKEEYEQMYEDDIAYYTEWEIEKSIQP